MKSCALNNFEEIINNIISNTLFIGFPFRFAKMNK
jgi:hypothetical protein